MNVTMILACMEIVQILLEALYAHVTMGIQVSNHLIILILSPVKHFSNKYIQHVFSF